MLKSRERSWRWLAVATCLVMIIRPGMARAQDDPSAPIQMDTLEVVDVTPVGGAGMPIDKIPMPVQVLSAEDLRKLRPLDITDGLGTRLGSVHLSNLGSNPFQPDVNYRGFRGSPLLGLPQGVSVFVDGARANETFGDVVNWDLIPSVALARIELMPGSNPAFGLNTLGGALSLHTKSGFSDPGAQLRGYGGSNGRFSGEGEIGGRFDTFGYYAAGSAFREDGWRDFSSSDVQQLFAKGTWVGGQTSVDLSTMYASSSLRGNGAVPVELIAQNRSAVFTHPDETSNELGQMTVSATRSLSRSMQLSATVYGRFTRTDTFNGDDSDYGACPTMLDVVGVQTATDALCFGVEDEEGEMDEGEDEPRQVFDREGDPVLVNDAVDSATQNTTRTDQRRLGGSLQTRWRTRIAGAQNRLVVGGQAAAGYADFSSQTELGRLTTSRGTVGSGIFDLESFTEVETRTQTGSVYFVNTFSPTGRLSVTVSGRYTSTNVTLDDQLGTALNGDHTFYRFNPAAGLTYAAWSNASVFVNVSQSNRAPTPVELTCADENDPCRLPNGFQADPPLDQVVATTYSAGVRSAVRTLRVSASLFRTVSRDDIYFISAGPARNSGFFDNIGQTRRQGVELSASQDLERVGWFASYSLIDATFRDGLTVNAPNHPNAIDGEIQVEEGDRLPLTPWHVGKVGMDVSATPWLSLGGTAILQGQQYLRGDESNELEPLDAFITVNVEMTARVYQGISLFAKADNLFDTRFETAGLLGEPDEVDAFESFENPRFVTPGAPRMIRAGVDITF